MIILLARGTSVFRPGAVGRRTDAALSRGYGADGDARVSSRLGGFARRCLGGGVVNVVVAVVVAGGWGPATFQRRTLVRECLLDGPLLEGRFKPGLLLDVVHPEVEVTRSGQILLEGCAPEALFGCFLVALVVRWYARAVLQVVVTRVVFGEFAWAD